MRRTRGTRKRPTGQAPTLPAATRAAVSRTGALTTGTPVSMTPSFSGLSLGMGGRLSLDTPDTYLGATRVITAPMSADDTWRTLSLDDATLDRYTPDKLLQLLSDLSPDVSRAIFDFLRLCNPGYEVLCLRPGTEEQDTAAQAVLDAFLTRLHDLYGTADVVISRLFMSAFLRGAFMAELVLDEAGRAPVDLATPDPMSARFRREIDPQRGPIWQLGQWQLGGFVALDRPTIRYIPVDPFPGSPYGRPLAAPALFTALFLLGLLHDLRRVVAQQGYPRLDISINSERLLLVMPELDRMDPQKFKDWANAVLAEVRDSYSNLAPDDAYVHLDVIEMKRPVGTADSSSLGAVDGLITGLERMLTRALKTVPLLMGLEQGGTEAAANRQYEFHIQGIKAMQHYAENLLQGLMTLALQAQGVAATVQWRFAENRASEMMRDATTQGLKLSNARQGWNAGYVNADEAAMMAVGHKADVQQPRVLERGETLDAGTSSVNAAAAADTADAGSKRSTPLRVLGGA